ncbi:MAG: hypothetical protein NXH95_12955 [Pseudomonadaceae bacterium]|nr:hypothetical protein [Pseudomonadaceae bacterium]
MQRMQKRRITIAFGIALAAHVGAIWWLADEPFLEDSEPATKIDLVLTQVALPDKPVQPDQQVEDTQVNEVLPDPLPQVSSEPEATPELKVPSATPLPQLDLTRPDNWSEVESSAEAPEDFARAFRGEFYQRLEQRQIDQARSQLLSGRRVAQRGLPADQYNALERPGSGHFKTAAGCFDLKADIVGTIGGGQRAWITACKDLIRSPFELPPVEFDVLGRAIVP